MATSALTGSGLLGVTEVSLLGEVIWRFQSLQKRK
jgi:hypothetical protein